MYMYWGLNMDKEEKELEARRYFINKYWLACLSAIEKKALQSMAEEENLEYKLDNEEKKAIMFLGLRKHR